MAKVSVIIPSRNEKFLPQTIDDVLNNATGDVECIAILDGYWHTPQIVDRDNLIILHRGKAMGMRAAINAGAAISKGAFLMKCDAHCSFQKGWDEILQKDCADNWIVIPRRDRLDAENWTLQHTGKSPVDYHYLSCPITNPDNYSFHGAIWNERGKERRDSQYDIDDTPSFQGSCWFMSRKHWAWLGEMSEEGYGSFCQEPQEIGMKTWLGGGRIVVNKRVTYLHLHKGKQYGRGYFQDKNEIAQGHEWSARYWMNNKWKDRKFSIEWFINEKFPHMPTWIKNWEDVRNEWLPRANPKP